MSFSWENNFVSFKKRPAFQNVIFFINISKGPASKLDKVTRDGLKFLIRILSHEWTKNLFTFRDSQNSQTGISR